MRTQDEIATKVAESNKRVLDFTGDALLCYLDFEHARPFLKPEATAEGWAKSHTPLVRESVIAEMRDYMAFAWGKVEDHRGLSAGRSVDKMTAWAWLLGDDALVKAIDAAGYAQYGAPKLAVVCKALGFDIPDDPGIARMIDGERCGADYSCGCGQ